jgi:hypothetical protein
LALFAYSTLAIMDTIPYPFAAEPILIQGTFDDEEPRTNYSPFGIKGVLYLQGHDVPFGVREALGHGFEHITNELRSGDQVTLIADAHGLTTADGRIEDIANALRDAGTEQEYQIAIRQISRYGTTEPIPLLEVRLGGEIIYSRLSITPDARSQVRILIFFAFGSLLFMLVVRRLAIA